MGPASGENMHTEERVNVPKLTHDSSNWVDYRDCILWLLESQNIDTHIADDTMPTSYTTDGKISSLEPPEHWKKEETVIRQVIGPSMLPTAFTCIKGQKMVKGAWEMLKRIYKEKTHGLAMDVMRRFRNTRCGESDSVRTHFEHMANVCEQLAAMGKAISDDDYMDILLTSLPHSYDQLCTSISNSTRVSRQPLTADNLKAMILAKFTQREIKKQKSNTKDEAFAADTPKSKKQCSNCNKCGHLKADCWAKGGGKEGQGPKRKDKAQDSTAMVEKNELEVWAVVEEVSAKEDQGDFIGTAGSPLARLGQAHDAATELYDSGAS